MRGIINVIVLSILLTACGQDPLPQLPDGERSVMGTVVPAGLSATRRGTHLLQRQGEDIVYLESAIVNIGELVGRNVELAGLYEYNIDPFDIPVFVVLELIRTEETTYEWDFPTLGLTLITPLAWERAKEDGLVQFFTPQQEKPLLTVYRESTTESLDAVHGSVPIAVGARRALRTLDERTGQQTVYIPDNDGVIVLLFSPQTDIADSLRQDWLQVLRDASFGEEEDEPFANLPTGSGAILGRPCGGLAGVLCPDGWFCEIQDFEEALGRCREVF